MKNSEWTNVPKTSQFGIAIFTFLDERPNRLKLFCGDAFHILQECGDWFYGYCILHPLSKGIVPKSYIHIKDAVLDKSGICESVIVEETPIAQEVTAVLREWGTLAKQLYVEQNRNFEKLQRMVFELIDLRKCVLSGTLPMDELKELNQKIISLIDIGNWTLSLDLVVRDDQGNILNSDWTSTINLFRQHELAAQRILRTKEGDSFTKPTVKFTHGIFLEIKNFVCKIGEDVQLLMTLYDAKEGRFISENYVIKWSKEGLPALDLLYNMKVIFTDLGNADLCREKVFLVCQVIRIGCMELKNMDKKSFSSNKRVWERVRRPFGVAVMDITSVISGNVCYDDDKQHFLPFMQCGERDFLDTLIKKLTSLREITQRESKGQGLWVSLKLLHGDVKQIREENPHIISIATDTARKMGFPEIIMPGDVRNDLYLTILSGEFAKGAKTSDKNVEVCVKACGEKGEVLSGVISIGSGVEEKNEYCSVVYYHEDKPKWLETIRVAIDIEKFRSSHLLFAFKHRSSNEAKDKSEKPFAISFVRLMLQNGTTLKDTAHDLLVYKVDHKKFEESDATYLKLPSTRKELEDLKNGESISKSALNNAGLTCSLKDSFQISTLVCSTKLTQNVDLLALLKWRDNPENLDTILHNLMKIDGEEVVKFLQDTLDALFNILMDNMESDSYDKKVFDALIYILGLISDSKYRHFKPVLDAYINPTFSAALAYKKLIPTLQVCVGDAGERNCDTAFLKRIMESLKYIFKFIVRSRWLCAQFSEDVDETEKRQFNHSFKQLLKSINYLMSSADDSLLLVQGACLKFFPSAISDILLVYDAKDLSSLLVYFINNVPPERLIKMKLLCIQEIIHGDLFKSPECRSILLPEIIQNHIGKHMEQGDEMELCVIILSDILDELHNQRVVGLPGETSADVSVIMLKIFRTVVQKVIGTDRKNLLVSNLVAVMISILRQMETFHYKQYIEQFKHNSDLLDFVMELLMIFTELVKKPVFPKDWNEMIMLQNSVLLKTVRHLSNTIRDVFFNPFEIQVWNNYFHCAIFFLTQEALQLENFSRNKRKKILTRYKDMRREAGFEIRAMWFNLGHNKIHFVPGLVGLFLEMTLIPESELRKATIPIFFDMMQCEFRSPKYMHVLSLYEIAPQMQIGGSIKGNFLEFEKEMITRIDALVSGGRGDLEYNALFSNILTLLCEEHQSMKDLGLRFVKTVTRLMENLLEYRSIIQEENVENRLKCTVNLMEFFSEINRQEMYIRYLNKLCDLHVECHNYTEAAFALKLHTKLLKWSEDPLLAILRNEKYPSCETHRQLKEKLYYEIIDYFRRGHMWEPALKMCKELAHQYEHETFDYAQLSALLKKKADFYDNIMLESRPEPEYFRVAFYGRGFTTFLQNKVFIFRGNEYEKLDEFTGRMQSLFPKAEIMMKLTVPEDSVLESNKQMLQLNKVDPVMEEKKKFMGKNVHEKILRYYKVNEVQKFTYSRPKRKGLRDSDNEFADLWVERTTMVISSPLPCILRWFPVISSETIEITPLENAIETMRATNIKIRSTVMAHMADHNLSANPLGMLLNGIVDAAVMGGIAKYEQAFFNENYLVQNELHKENIDILKDLIACQIPLLGVGIEIHKNKIHESLKPFHENLEQCFMSMKVSVEEKYGKRETDLGNMLGSMPAKQKTISTDNHFIAKSLPDINNILSESNKLKLPVNLRLSHASSQQKLTTTASRVQSVFSKPIQSSSRTLRKSRDTLPLRRSSGLVSPQPIESQSQWYDQTPSSVIELNQQLVSQRPRRSEAEKRNSRPSSGHFRNLQYDNNTSPSSTPEGGASSLSLNSLEDDTPPPVPQKQNLNDSITSVPATPPDTNPVPTFQRTSGTLSRIKNKPLPPLPIKEKTPPAVPKKPIRSPSKDQSVC